ncbi:MAG: sodium:solute symporter [Bacteroidales bacterium]|jgi:SSS family transporter|nr:sodium:solute symporter [Bacteroidales bacterium]
MSFIILCFFISYILLLFVISWATSRGSKNTTYFTGNRKSPWFVVAYGMIGSSLSGVTFMSVPGDVATTQFSYFGVVLGYILGYLVIITVLLPLYYRLRQTSIYEYLGSRFGQVEQKTGALLFIISRLAGSALRMYLVIFVLQRFVFNAWGIPVWLTASFMIVVISLYTFRGGVKTVVWTDTLQTTFMILALILTIVVIFNDLNFNLSQTWYAMNEAGYTRFFNTDWHEHDYFLKQVFGGMFITIAMTGLDQDMMQKNLSCKNLREARFNMMSFTGILVIVNSLFLFLGALMLLYARQNGIMLTGMPTDGIYPELAFNHLGIFVGGTFVIGLIAAGFSSADGTFTALTTSVCYDLFHIETRFHGERPRTLFRYLVHLIISVLFLFIIIVCAHYHDDALIRIIFTVASYTYGPILGLFAFGGFSRRKTRYPVLVPVIALLSPLFCFILSSFSKSLLHGYEFGFELLIINGLFTFFMLWLNSIKDPNKQSIS